MYLSLSSNLEPRNRYKKNAFHNAMPNIAARYRATFEAKEGQATAAFIDVIR